MAVSKIYDGTAWVDIILKVWDGTVWQSILKYFDGVAWIDLAFFGTAAISARTVSSSVSSGTPLAQIALRADGTLETRILNANWVVISGEWFLTGEKTDMEVVVTLTNGSFTGGSEGTFALGTTDRVWQRNSVVDDFIYKKATATYEIRHINSGQTLAGPVTITLRARKGSI